MKGFKDTTRVQYFKGGAVTREKACGGMVKKATGGKVKIVAPGDIEPYGNKGTYKYREEGPGFRMDETEFRVMRDISNRDRADSEKAKRPNASKLDKMAGREAVSRMNRMGWAEEGFNEDTGIGLIHKSRQKGAAAARSDAVRPNYVKKAEGGRVTDPVKNKTGGKNDPEYGDYAISGAGAPANETKAVRKAQAAKTMRDTTGAAMLPAERRAMMKKAEGGKVTKDDGYFKDLVRIDGKLRERPKGYRTADEKRAQESVEKSARNIKRQEDAENFGKQLLGGVKSKYAEGGKVDMKQDKKAVAAGVHKHERALHPGKPMTKMQRGGFPSHSKAPLIKAR